MYIYIYICIYVYIYIYIYIYISRGRCRRGSGAPERPGRRVPRPSPDMCSWHARVLDPTVWAMGSTNTQHTQRCAYRAQTMRGLRSELAPAQRDGESTEACGLARTPRSRRRPAWRASRYRPDPAAW